MHLGTLSYCGDTLTLGNHLILGDPLVFVPKAGIQDSRSPGFRVRVFVFLDPAGPAGWVFGWPFYVSCGFLVGARGIGWAAWHCHLAADAVWAKCMEEISAPGRSKLAAGRRVAVLVRFVPFSDILAPDPAGPPKRGSEKR